jgi:hypothetical protein
VFPLVLGVLLHVGIAPCSGSNERVELVVHGSSVLDESRQFEMHVTGRPSDLARRPVTVDVTPGSYVYSVSENPIDGSATPLPACNSGQEYVTVLPGRSRSVRVALTAGIGYRVPPILISGIKERFDRVSVYSLVGSAPCNDPLADSQVTIPDGGLSLTNDATAYYAEVFPMANPVNRLLLRVEALPWGIRWILVDVPTPDPNFNGKPATLRFDLTPKLLEKLRETPADSLMCV